MHTITHFLSLCDEVKSAERFIAELHKLTRYYGFEYYRIVRRDVDDLTFTGNILAELLPEGWSTVYHDKKYGDVDPVKRMLGLSQRPFRWRDVINLLPHATHRKRASKMFQDAARYGLREGYAFPIHGRSGLLGGVFIGGQGCHFTPAELTLIDTAMRAAFWRLMEFAGRSKELLTFPDLSTTKLTRRELDVLTLLAQGQTSGEIGKGLEISNHTVDWYINGIQRKFKAKNRQHVIALAFRSGIIA